DGPPPESPNLGEFVVEYRLGPLYSLMLLAGGVAALLSSLAILGALYAALAGWPAAKAAAGGRALFELGMIGLFLFGTGLSVLRRIVRNRGLRVVVFAEGLVRQQGVTVEALPWDDVDVLRYPPAEEET